MKQNIGKIVMIELQKVKGEGIVPSTIEESKNIPWQSVTKQIQKWENEGKVICIKESATPYISTYALTKYIETNKYN